ncbi:MAG: sensor histidine kinase [Porphyromonadaceae bacterium]|nr:sensor histidine kinase [Porphyromonadaceae bacterium]
MKREVLLNLIVCFFLIFIPGFGQDKDRPEIEATETTVIDTRPATEIKPSAELEKRYKTGKKELRIGGLERRWKLHGIIASTWLVFLLLLSLLLYLRQKSVQGKKKLAEQKIIQLMQEKQIIATQAVMDGETAERSRLACDLHDGLGGMLSAVKLNLFEMKQDLVMEAEDISRFNKVVEMLDNCMQELRRVAHNMMPESLSMYGLKVAVEDFCHSFPNVRFHFFGEEKRIDKKTEITLYRAIFELINNAVKHAHAEHINVQVIQQPDRIFIAVEDDGIGFDTPTHLQGTGLHNVANRINSAGGTLNILSSKGKGTEITIEMNIDTESDEQD